MSNAMDLKAGLDAQIQTALEVKMRSGYTQTAVVHRRWTSARKFVLGFDFRDGLRVGDTYVNDDGTVCEVLALV